MKWVIMSLTNVDLICQGWEERHDGLSPLASEDVVSKWEHYLTECLFRYLRCACDKNLDFKHFFERKSKYMYREVLRKRREFLVCPTITQFYKCKHEHSYSMECLFLIFSCVLVANNFVFYNFEKVIYCWTLWVWVKKFNIIALCWCLEHIYTK
jgi:hypothetical protein